MFPSTFLSILTGQSAEISVLPEVRHLAAPLWGSFGCFRFWECWSLGGREILATKNTKSHKESARHAPNVVQWFHGDNRKQKAAS